MRRSYTSNESPDHSCKLAKTKLVLSSVSVWQHDLPSPVLHSRSIFSVRKDPPPRTHPLMPAALAQWAGKLIRIYDWWHLAFRKGSRSYGGALLADCGTQARACNNCTATVSTSSASLADGVLCQSSWKKVENNQQVSENTL